MHDHLVLVFYCLLAAYPNLCDSTDFLSILNQLNVERNLKEVIVIHSFSSTLPGWSSIRTPRYRELQNPALKVTFLDSVRVDNFIRLSVASLHPMTTTLYLALDSQQAKTVVRKIIEDPDLPLSEISRSFELLIPISSMDMIDEIVSDAYLPINTQVYFIFLPPTWLQRSPLTIYEAYHIPLYRSDNHPLRITIRPLGKSARIPSKLEELWVRRADLQRTVIRGGVRKDQQWVIIRKHAGRNGSIASNDLSGFIPDIWSELEKILNCSTVYQKSSEKSWGTVSSDNRWLGLVGMLQRSEIDVAVAGLTVTTNRRTVADFTPYLYHENHRVYFDKSRESYVASITEVMTWDILLFIIVVVTVTSAAQALVLRFTLNPKDRRERYTADAIFFNNLYAFCQQGTLWQKTSKLFSSQLVLWVTYCCGMIIFNMYSATLISRLTYTRVDFPYYSLVDLANSGKFHLIAVRGTGSLAILKHCDRDATCEAEINSDATDMPANSRDAIRRVCTGNFAFYTSGKYEFQKHGDHYHHRDHLHMCRLDFFQTRDVDGRSIGFTKRNPYRNIINFYLKKMAEGGILKRVRDKWYRTEDDTEWIPSSINMLQAAPLFWWIAVGILVSLVVLVAELCVFHVGNGNKPPSAIDLHRGVSNEFLN